MADKVVSVRMPPSMLDELKRLAEQNHFLDVSEEVRSLLRDKWMEHSDPYAIKLMAIKDSVSKRAVPQKIQSLREELTSLLEEIDGLT